MQAFLAAVVSPTATAAVSGVAIDSEDAALHEVLLEVYYQ